MLAALGLPVLAAASRGTWQPGQPRVEGHRLDCKVLDGGTRRELLNEVDPVLAVILILLALGRVSDRLVVVRPQPPPILFGAVLEDLELTH